MASFRQQLFTILHEELMNTLNGVTSTLRHSTVDNLQLDFDNTLTRFNIQQCRFLSRKLLSKGSNGAVYRGIGIVGGVQKKLAIKIESPDLSENKIIDTMATLMEYGRTEYYIATHGYILTRVFVSNRYQFVLISIMDMGLMSFSDYLKSGVCFDQRHLLEFERNSPYEIGVGMYKYEFKRLTIKTHLIHEYLVKLSHMIDLSEGYDFKPGNSLVIDRSVVPDQSDLGIVIIDIDRNYSGFNTNLVQRYVVNPFPAPNVPCNPIIFKCAIMFLNILFIYKYLISTTRINFFERPKKFITFLSFKSGLLEDSIVPIFTHTDEFVSAIDYCINMHSSGMIFQFFHYLKTMGQSVHTPNTQSYIDPNRVRDYLNYLKCWITIGDLFTSTNNKDLSAIPDFLNDPQTINEFVRLHALYPHRNARIPQIPPPPPTLPPLPDDDDDI